MFIRFTVLYLVLTAASIALVFGYNYETHGRIMP